MHARQRAICVTGGSLLALVRSHPQSHAQVRDSEGSITINGQGAGVSIEHAPPSPAHYHTILGRLQGRLDISVVHTGTSLLSNQSKHKYR